MIIPFDKHIQEQFNRVIEYSQSLDDICTDELFATWAEKKAWMYDALGGLIYEYPKTVTFSLDEDTRQMYMDEFIDTVGNIDGSLAEFIKQNADGFYENKTVKMFKHNGDTINVGMKINKAIGRYWKEEIDYDVITDLQNDYSRIIQQNKVSGHLCLSIHPLDFLSASENQHNWRSCHALDGEYRVGNLSYMGDNCTIMAYLKSDSDVILPHFPSDVPWNNKKWRCWFFFDRNNGLVYAGRQYPFHSEVALDIIKDNIFKKLIKNQTFANPVNMSWKHNCDSTVMINNKRYELNDTYMTIGGDLVKIKSLVQDAENSLHFNDLTRSSFYKPITLRYTNSRDNKPMIVGHQCNCLRCNSNRIYNSDCVLCSDCAIEDETVDVEWIVECAHCGKRILEENAILNNDEYYCIDCVESNSYSCANCGAKICTLFDETYIDKDGEPICWFCQNKSRKKSLFSLFDFS